MADPFENEEASYLVLVNQLGQHSLWPQAFDVPSGWEAVSGPGGRRECLDYVTANWADITPKSRPPQVNVP
jgi:MbtH protein